MQEQTKAGNSNPALMPDSHNSGAPAPASQDLSPDKEHSTTRSPNEDSGSSPIPHRATGPRTKAGKRRSRYNAVKHGLFAKAILLDGESAAQYEALRKGLWEEFPPESASEMEDVEYLVTLYWRRGRIARAENAQIANAAEFDAYNSKWAQEPEVWDQSRAGETTGGMLRHNSNPLVVREAIEMLTIFRDSVEKHGFHAREDPWILRKLYGLDHDGAAPMGLFRAYMLQSKLATGGRIGNMGSYDNLRKDPDELKKEMLTALDEELERLKLLEAVVLASEKKKREYATIAALIPPRDIMDAIIRAETHISREIDRTRNRLEQARRRRQGQPEPPTLRLKLDE